MPPNMEFLREVVASPAMNNDHLGVILSFLSLDDKEFILENLTPQEIASPLWTPVTQLMHEVVANWDAQLDAMVQQLDNMMLDMQPNFANFIDQANQLQQAAAQQGIDILHQDAGGGPGGPEGPGGAEGFGGAEGVGGADHVADAGHGALP